MSLIVDINPVPWKILDLVKARILKNRAKKAKKVLDWSTDLRREMALAPAPLISRRRDEPSFIPGSQVAVGVGWLDIGYNYTVISNTAPVFDSGWSNGLPPSNSLNFDSSFTRTTRTTGFTRTSTASLEFVITVGTGSGETWKQVRHSLTFSGTSGSSTEVTHYRYTYSFQGGPTVVLRNNRNRSSGSANFCARLWHGLFPAGPSEIILVITIAQFSRNGAFYDDGAQSDDPTVGGDATSSVGSFTVQSTKQISILITQASVTELTHPLPAFIQKRINSVLSLPVYQWPGFDVDHPDIRIEQPFPQSAIGTYQLGFNSVSSVIYESIAPDGTFSVVSPQQAKASYAEYSGIPEIPVLGYKRDDPSVASTPTTERGAFGIITGASVTAPVTPEMLALGLEDELEQAPGASAANQPEPVRMVVAYDYHGGNYCRDRLSQLGITV